MNKRQAKKFKKKQYEKRKKEYRELLDRTQKGLDNINQYCITVCNNVTKCFSKMAKIMNTIVDEIEKK